ncbi:class I SAM-dependent methyltransferase [Kitasatospora sp. NPDC056783]|uniref:class I SAM-dependent methyltransferase n=1 Tax=Kitasatospora sp. NPDC056783 TaxID=3345943 RepID=UPI00369F42BA
MPPNNDLPPRTAVAGPGRALGPSGTPDDDYARLHAADYDRWFAKTDVTPATVDLLARLAGPGPVLELGIGTGRLALPLARRGHDVHGIEASEEMLRELRAKPGGTRIPVTVGDFAEVPAPGPFSLVYAAGGTFFELPDRDAQRHCLRQVAAKLTPGGRFVLDALVPETLAVAAASGTTETVSERDGRLVRCRRRIDHSTRSYQSHYVIHEDGRTHHVRVRFHYLSPGELDLLAESAGLRLAERHGTWDAGAFTGDSTYHVSVYERPTARSTS